MQHRSSSLLSHDMNQLYKVNNTHSSTPKVSTENSLSNVNVFFFEQNGLQFFKLEKELRVQRHDEKSFRSIKNNFSSLPHFFFSQFKAITRIYIEVIVFQSNFNFLKPSPTPFLSLIYDDAHRTSNFGWWWQQIIFSRLLLSFGFSSRIFLWSERVESDYNSVAVAHMMEDWKCNYGVKSERILIILGMWEENNNEKIVLVP
jgi:hypothetical protein